MTKKSFHLGDLISVISGRLISPNLPPDHLDGLCAILSHMTGRSLQTFKLLEAADRCQHALLAQFPFLADIRVPQFEDQEHGLSWLAGQVAIYGERFEVEPLGETTP